MARRAGGVQAWVEQGERCRPTAIVRTGVVLGGDAWGGCAHWVPLLRRNAFARKVEFDESLRALVGSMAEEMHALYRRRHTPRVKPFSACRSCSLNDLCLPRAINRATVGEYVAKRLSEEEL